MSATTYFVDDEIGAVPVITVLDSMPADGTAVVISDESGAGSLWIEWQHHGEVDVRSSVAGVASLNEEPGR